jgi:hypothetical protein
MNNCYGRTPVPELRVSGPARASSAALALLRQAAPALPLRAGAWQRAKRRSWRGDGHIRWRLKCGRCGMKEAQLVVLPPV